MGEEIIPSGKNLKIPSKENSTDIVPSGSNLKLPGQPSEPEAPGFFGTVKDVGKSLASGALRGTAGLADLPSDLAQLAVLGGEKLTGSEAPTGFKDFINTNFREGMSDLTGGFSERKPETTLGRYAGTIGEFVPGAVGAAITGGGSMAGNVLRGAIAPAVGSEFLGQMVEGSTKPELEPYARLAGAILGGIGANKIENLARGVISPTGGADPVRLAMAESLRKKGVPVTAGQATGSKSIMGAEADTELGQMIAGVAPNSEQAKAFTGATMKHIGSPENLATPQAMASAEQSIVNRMTGAVRGIDVPPSLPLSNKVADAADYYTNMTPDMQRIPMIRGIIDRINQGEVIPAEQLATWRSSLGKLLYHENEGIRGTAFRLREAIDDAIENSMRAAGQPRRIEAWKTARDQYRNLLAVSDALKVTKQAGIEGIITPRDLMASLAKQDKSGVVTGRRGDIADLARTGMSIMSPLPTTARRGLVDAAVRRAGPVATAAGMGYGALQAAQWAGLSPMLTAGSMALAAGKPFYEAGKDLVRGYAMNPSVQKYLENQLVGSTSGASNLGSGLRAAGYGAPSILDEREGRKSGGRVGVSHDKMADQLVMAAERAKKGISKGTESLLEMPDDHVAHALEVANRSI